jgi:hypothetical protein
LEWKLIREASRVDGEARPPGGMSHMSEELFLALETHGGVEDKINKWLVVWVRRSRNGLFFEEDAWRCGKERSRNGFCLDSGVNGIIKKPLLLKDECRIQPPIVA